MSTKRARRRGGGKGKEANEEPAETSRPSRAASPSASAPAPRFPPCQLKHLAWARLFGLPPSSVGSPSGRRDLCDKVSEAIPVTARHGYRVARVLNRGAYGVVFVAHKPGAAEMPWAALKLQFVCPTAAKQHREACAAFGQRASPYDVVRYEALQHARVHQLLAAALASPRNAGLPIPAVPTPIAARRMIVGKRGQYPGVPPDGRRRLWVSLMELMPARSLRQTMLDAKRKGTLTAETFESVCRGIAKHLRAFHELGVTHGDLHSGNVLLDQERAAAGRPWVVFVDLERSIPREFVQQSPMVRDAKHGEGLWDVARMWDLKVFVESIVRLAESAGIYHDPVVGSSSAAATTSSSSHRRSELSATPPRQRLLRAKNLAMVVLSSYTGRRADSGGWMTGVAGNWAARAIWLKRHPAKSALPEEVAEELGGAERVVRADREEHGNFFQLLRAVQHFYTAPKRKLRAATAREGIDPAAILPDGQKRNRKRAAKD